MYGQFLIPRIFYWAYFLSEITITLLIPTIKYACTSSSSYAARGSSTLDNALAMTFSLPWM